MKGGIIMIVLYIILAIIVVLCAVLLLNAALQTKGARKLKGQHPTFTGEQLEVYYDPENPSRFAFYSFGPNSNPLCW